MADFSAAIDYVIEEREGGYKVINVPGDRGGQTCAGISRRANPDWGGWALIDAGVSARDPRVVAMIRERYRIRYWNPIQGDSIVDQNWATDILSCAVLSGPRTAVRLAQIVVGVDQDGIMGPKTLHAVNTLDNILKASPSTIAQAMFALVRIARFAAICNKDRNPDPKLNQRKFLLGWVNRALGEGMS